MTPIYRNEVIPDYGFVNKLKLVDKNLYVAFDSSSGRWHVFYKSPKIDATFLVYKVCERSGDGEDIGYRALDDRTINDLLRYDVVRRNKGIKDYVRDINNAEDEVKKKRALQAEDDNAHFRKINRPWYSVMYDNLRGIHRKKAYY